MEFFIGEIFILPFDKHIRGAAKCDGQLLSINQNQALYSLLGTHFGGNGRTTMGLPDLRGRTPIGSGQGGNGLPYYSLGDRGGEEKVTLTTDQIPFHSHEPYLLGVADRGYGQEVNGSALAQPQVGSPYSEKEAKTDMHSGSIETEKTGGSQGHNNMMPYLTLCYYIAMHGIFPARN